jgi:hypothetical protein
MEKVTTAEPFFRAPEEGEPTCKICTDLAMMPQDEPQKNNDQSE